MVKMVKMDCKPSESAITNFQYLRLNARRLEHLASLGLPIAGGEVLEVGAGIGDLTSFFLDRGCSVTAIQPRPENRACFASQYGDAEVMAKLVRRVGCAVGHFARSI